MFYHWKTNTSWPRCYISSWVSASKQLVAGNKSYIAEGDVTAIEIWNVTNIFSYSNNDELEYSPKATLAHGYHQFLES